MKNYEVSKTDFTATAYNTGWKQNITTYEEKGRNAVNTTLPKLFKNEVEIKKITSTTITDPVDLIVDISCDNNDSKIGIEVKCFNITYTYCKYPSNKIPESVVIKKDKVERMLKYRKEHKLNYLVYAVLVNNKMYYFDISKLDFVKLHGAWINQKVTQMNPTSEMVCKYMYFIPLSQAIKVIDYGNNQ